MPARAAKPVPFLTEEHKRARRIFARLMGGEAMRAIAASENLSLRRVQQIVREQLDRRNANPADDFALLQIARLERALDLIGSQIDAGKPAAAHAFVRILDHLNQRKADRLWLEGVTNGSATKSTLWMIGSVASTRRARLWRSGRRKRPRKAHARIRRNERTAKPLITNETAKWLIRRPQ